VALAVFKTVAGRPAPSWVGSTPMRSRHNFYLVAVRMTGRHTVSGSEEAEPLPPILPPNWAVRGDNRRDGTVRTAGIGCPGSS